LCRQTIAGLSKKILSKVDEMQNILSGCYNTSRHRNQQDTALKFVDVASFWLSLRVGQNVRITAANGPSTWALALSAHAPTMSAAKAAIESLKIVMKVPGGAESETNCN
jgi:hypothetical protein